MWRFARAVSRMVAVLLCLGVFLSLAAGQSEVPSAFGVANVAPMHQGANGNAPPLDGTYLFAPAEETEDTGKRPVNADLLTMLLLAASYLGANLGWLLTQTQRQRVVIRFLVVRPSLASAGKAPPSLGVFRL